MGHTSKNETLPAKSQSNFRTNPPNRNPLNRGGSPGKAANKRTTNEFGKKPMNNLRTGPSQRNPLLRVKK